MSSSLRPSVRKRRRSVTPCGSLRRRGVERARRGRLPVHDELLLLLVVHPAAADVERRARIVSTVEPAEAEPALGVLVGAQPLRRPRVHRGLGDLAVDLVAGAGHDLAHPLEVLVGPIDVALALSAGPGGSLVQRTDRDLRCKGGRTFTVNRREFVALAAAAPFAVRATLAAAAAAPLRARHLRRGVAARRRRPGGVQDRALDRDATRAARDRARRQPRRRRPLGARETLDRRRASRAARARRASTPHAMRRRIPTRCMPSSRIRATASSQSTWRAAASSAGSSSRAGRATSRSTRRGRRCGSASVRRRRRWRSSTSVTRGGRGASRSSRRRFGAHDVGFSPDGREVWVTSGAAGETAIYSAGRKLRTTLPADAAPQHVTFSSAAAYVTSGDAGTLHLQSRTTGRVVRTTRIPVGSYNVQHGRNRVHHALALTWNTHNPRRTCRTARDGSRRVLVPRRLFRARLRLYESLTARQVDLYGARGI